MKNALGDAGRLLDSVDHVALGNALNQISTELGGRRLGGVLAIAAVWTGTDLYSFKSSDIGLPGPNFTRYALNTAEKIARLHERRHYGHDEIASSESADESQNEYGGCIVFRGPCSIIRSSTEKNFHAYISFSGAPPEVDEAIVFVLGEMLGFNTPAAYYNSLITRVREIMKTLKVV